MNDFSKRPSSELLDRQWRLAFEGEAPPHVNSPDDDSVYELQTAGGDLQTLRVRGRYLHSRHDPLREATRQAEAIIVPERESLILFFGAGLGYLVRLFLEGRPNPCVWFEPDERILTFALSVVDLREQLSAGRLRIVRGFPTGDQLEEIFRGRGNRQIQFAAHPASFSLAPDYERVRQSCENYLNRKDVNLATMSRFDRLWARNLCANFAHLSGARPVSLLFDTYPGGRALVCGAGPSLTDSLEEIRQRRRGSVLIAVDTALLVLEGADIEPDIVVSVDPQPINRFHLEGVRGESLFVVDPTVSYHSLRLLPPGRTFFTASPFPLAELFFEYLDGPPGDIAFGGSVSTNAYDLAVRMGCGEIILYGQDLGFSAGQVHARGAALEERINLRESRLYRREKDTALRLRALPGRTLPAIGGGTVDTNDRMVIFHRWFSGRIAADRQKGIRVINRTARGALLPDVSADFTGDLSADHRPFDIERFRRDERRDEFIRDEQNGAYRLEKRSGFFSREEFCRALRELGDDFRELARLLEGGLRLAEEILELASRGDRSERYSKLLKEMQRIDAELQRELRPARILGAAMQRIILRITENYETTSNGKRPENGDERVAVQSRDLYAGLAEACGLHIRWLEKARRIMEQETG